jgi:hypothetical protein
MNEFESGYSLLVVECLAPGNECETSKGLRLELEGEVEVLHGISSHP